MKHFPIWLNRDIDMLFESKITSVSGRLIGPKSNTSILSVLSFVEEHLIDFSKKYKNSNIENEKGLTQKLCILLNSYADGYPFWFDKEYMELPEKGNSPQIDIGVFSRLRSDDAAFFSFEAKRLDYISKAREKEYVTGREENGVYIDTGGVERFKKEIHGKNLNYCGMIGYIQKYDFQHWHEKINSWVDELINISNNSGLMWNEEDRLIEDYVKAITARYKSEHTRLNTGKITLFHLWVLLI